MAVAVELEDDLFFADLSKQISLLIMEDDEDHAAAATTYCPSSVSVSLQSFSSRGSNIGPPGQSFFAYEQINCASGNGNRKGTGVFIPSRLSQPRRKQSQKQGRLGSVNNMTKSHMRGSDINYSTRPITTTSQDSFN